MAYIVVRLLFVSTTTRRRKVALEVNAPREIAKRIKVKTF